MRPVLLLLCLAAAAGAAQTNCPDIRLDPGSDYSLLTASAAGVPGSFRWLVNGAAVAGGASPQLFLFHADANLASDDGRNPVTARGVTFQPGRWGSAFTLDPGGALTYARAGALDLSEGTMEMWVALRAPGADPTYSSRDHVLFEYTAPNGDWSGIVQNGSAGLIYAGGSAGGLWQSAWGGGGIESWDSGEWHHLAFTWSASANRMQFYVDGALVADTNEGRYTPPSSAGTVFSLGGDADGNVAAYVIDEVRISARALDAAEVRASASRIQPVPSNEITLALAGRAAGDNITFEWTPPGGAACTASYTFPGIPITGADPPSTLLPPASTSVALSLQTAAAASCRYSVNTRADYTAMTAFDSGDGATDHHVTVRGLAAETTVVNNVFVRCSSDPHYALKLLYRSLPSVNANFPRKGNLWGTGELRQKGLEHAARIDLHLGSDFSPSEIRKLRALNPNILVLNSINAVENFNLPDDYYLKDTKGNKIEVWPGTYRLNLTKPYVAQYQAHYAYQLILDSGLQFDGCFFDNFFLTESWLNHDIYGNPVQLDADEDGKPDDPATLDAAWRAGVFAEMREFRRLMPYALTSGHHFRPPDPDVLTLFNGDSVGFMSSDVLEGRQSLDQLWIVYDDWFQSGRRPVIMMLESSPQAQISYGYDYDPLQKIPASTLEFARTYFPYIRFGLTFVLMTDGYFAHEFGDAWHGNDWWYDELDFNLGQPLGPMKRIPIGNGSGNEIITNGGFESPLANTWDMWVNTDAGAAASVSVDGATAAAGNASALITITSAGQGLDWHIDFHQYDRALQAGTLYELSFWAKADAPRAISLSVSKESPDWRTYGLSGSVNLGTDWKRYAVTFTATETVTDARVQFLVGAAAGKVWLDSVSLTDKPPEVWRRDFTQGIALLNAGSKRQTVPLEPGFRRLTGSQAARHEYIVDDADDAFTAGTGWHSASYDSGRWQATGPFYHHWASGCRQCDGSCAPSSWDLALREDDTYTIAAWWAAAPGASSWSRKVVFELIAAGEVIATTTVDQSTGGDQWHVLFTQALRVADAPFVRVRNAGSGPAIADALWVRSAARYNDGSDAPSVALEPLDGIVLLRSGPPPAAGAGAVVDGASFLVPIAPGSWASVFGSNLALSTRLWNGADFNGQAMPLSLDGTRVEVNGAPAPVSFISPGQVNFQVPSSTSAGPGVVQVFSGGGASAPVSVDAADPSPALFLYDPQQRRYAAAQHAGGAPVIPNSLVPGGSPARPGEEIVLWGSGFGLTDPPVTSGFILPAPAPLANTATLSVTIGGAPAAVHYAGMTIAGVYQINVVVPDVADGDQPLVVSFAGKTTQPGVYISVAR